jgi:membrane protein
MPAQTAPSSLRRPRGSWRLALTAAPWLGLAALLALWPRGGQVRPKPGLSNPETLTPEGYAAREPGRGRLAASPARIPPAGWKDVAWRVWKEVGADRLSAVAGGVTFYALLAIFPAIGAFVAVWGLFADVQSVRDQLTALAAVMPREALALVGDQMLRLAGRQDAGLSLAFVFSLALSLWSANAGMKALFDGLNIAYDETERRGWLKLTLSTLLFTIGAILFLAVTTAVLVAAPWALRRLGLGGLDAIWAPLRWLVLLAASMAAFSLLYRFGPSRQLAKWRWVNWGAVFAAAGWLMGSLAFSWYVNNVAHYDVTYGSLGAVIGFMMWVWFSVMVLLIGAELNAEIEHQTALDSTTGPPQPIGARGAAMADTVGLAFRPNLSASFRRLIARFRPAPPPGSPAARPGPRRSAAR